MKKILALILVIVLSLSLCACGQTNITTYLSSSCDYLLCSGTDTNGNYYELVANQTETSLNYEISVGVIKNNQWLYPLSTDFPFLGEDGLFHVSAPQGGQSGCDLSRPGIVKDMISFVDSGAFVMESYNTRNASWVELYDHALIFFSCSTLTSYAFDYDEYTLNYIRSETERTISTDNGKILLYKETSGTSSGWLENQVFNWYLLDVQSLSIQTFASNMSGVRPESILSEGLFFASDKCFYNTNGQKVIDLSKYDIDMYRDSNLYFQNGQCSFTASNDLGSTFLITIDKSGNVLSEVKQ